MLLAETGLYAAIQKKYYFYLPNKYLLPTGKMTKSYSQDCFSFCLMKFIKQRANIIS